MRSRLISAKTVEDQLTVLSEVPWGDISVSLSVKTSTFFDGLINLFEVIETETEVNKLVHVLLMFMLMRVILATNVHPRLALLTGTVNQSMGDMWHTFLLVMTLQFSFAGIATWRFGADSDEYQTISTALQTQFKMLLGEFPESWTDSGDMIMYTVLYLIVLFLLVLNFILAIIVESYMTLRTVSESNEIELEFVSDFMYCCLARLRSKFHAWPGPNTLAKALERRSFKRTVGLEEFLEFDFFPTQSSAVEFLNHYNQFWFLKPKPLIQEKESERQVLEIETRVAWLLGKKPPTTLDRIQCMSKGWRGKCMKATDQGVMPTLSSPLPTLADGNTSMHVDIQKQLLENQKRIESEMVLLRSALEDSLRKKESIKIGHNQEEAIQCVESRNVLNNEVSQMQISELACEITPDIDICISI